MNKCIACIRNLFFTPHPLSTMEADIDHTKHALSGSTYLNTSPFVPQIKYGKVLKVCDGHTIIISAQMPHHMVSIFRFSVCLRGIDSPKFNTPNPFEKHAAILSRDALNSLLYDNIVILQNVSAEKNGRIVADIYLNDLHVNKWMLDHHYADKCDGKK